MKKKEETYCYSYFDIGSEGDILNSTGFVAANDSEFDPAHITDLLQIEPFVTRKKGEPRKGGGVFTFSSWSACRQCSPAIDAQAQCLSIVGALRSKIPILRQIKQKYNVVYTIFIVAHIYNSQSPILYFDSEIVEFCDATGTIIEIDQYVFDSVSDKCED